MIVILEWTQSNVQQNIEPLQTPTMRVTVNEQSTPTEHCASPWPRKIYAGVELVKDAECLFFLESYISDW